MKSLFGLRPNNIELYKLALIHRSASLFLPNGAPINNERLEYLGDAIIEAIVSDYLFIEFPQQDEGFLTQLRSKIVNRATLNRLAHEIGLDRYVIAQRGGRSGQKHIHGDALEAMIGAIYLDKGYDYTNRLMINRILKNSIDLDDLTETETDFKSRLIEWSQKHKMPLVFTTEPSPTYRQQHPNFQTTIATQGVCVGEGTADSKKEAEQVASEVAFEQREQIRDLIRLAREERAQERAAKKQEAERVSEQTAPNS